MAAEAGKRAAEEQLLKSSDESFFESIFSSSRLSASAFFPRPKVISNSIPSSDNSQLVLKEAKVAMLEQKVKELELVISAKK